MWELGFLVSLLFSLDNIVENAVRNLPVNVLCVSSADGWLIVHFPVLIHTTGDILLIKKAEFSQEMTVEPIGIHYVWMEASLYSRMCLGLMGSQHVLWDHLLVGRTSHQLKYRQLSILKGVVWQPHEPGELQALGKPLSLESPYWKPFLFRALMI